MPQKGASILVEHACLPQGETYCIDLICT